MVRCQPLRAQPPYHLTLRAQGCLAPPSRDPAEVRGLAAQRGAMGGAVAGVQASALARHAQQHPQAGQVLGDGQSGRTAHQVRGVDRRIQGDGVGGQADTGKMEVGQESLGSWGHSDIWVMKMDRQTLGPWTWRQSLRVAGSARCLVLALKWLAQATILQMGAKNTPELPLSLWTKACRWPLQGR